MAIECRYIDSDQQARPILLLRYTLIQVRKDELADSSVSLLLHVLEGPPDFYLDGNKNIENLCLE